MKTSSLALIVLGLVLGISLIAVWLSPSVRDFMASNTMWNGIKDFSRESRVDQSNSLANLPVQPENAVLISIPYLEYSPADLTRLKQFVENGNTLILMDDFGYGNDLLQSLGVAARFDHNLLLDPLFCDKNPALPRITDFSAGIREAGIEALAFNHATVLSHVETAQALAWSSSASFLDVNQNGVQDKTEPAGPFVVAAELPAGRGKIKLVSDPSLIINTMLNRNDNYQFVALLTGAGGRPGNLSLDRAHLSQAPLDVSQSKMETVKSVLGSPFALLGLIAAAFVLIISYTLKKGELFG